MFSKKLLTTSNFKRFNVFDVPVRKYAKATAKTPAKDGSEFDGIILAVPTPFAENQRRSVDYEKLKENVSKWERFDLKGYFIAGTNGEGPFLSDEEKLMVLKIVKSSADRSKLIIAGTTCESTERTCELSQAAAEAGADAVMIQTPYYFRTKMTDEVIIEHFTTIADKVAVPLLIYNNPFATSIDLSLNCIEILADHANIRGIKDTDVFKLGSIVRKTRGKNFNVIAGSAGYLLPSLLMGCSGGINGLSAILAQSICEMYALAKANEWDKAAIIQKRLILPDLLIQRELGPVGLKFAMDIMGYYGRLCRKPLHPLNEETKNKIRETLAASEYLSR